MKEKKEERKQISTKASPKLVPENKAQSRALQNLMSDKPYNFLIGEAGTGKTLMATVYAISKFLDGTYKKIVITRPAVSVDEELGYLPGSVEQKMKPWMLPILDVFMEFFTAEDIEVLMNEGLIEIAPLAYMRGRNLGPIDINETSDKRGFIVVADELQNSTPEQMKMLLTRLGKNSKMILTGDPTQHDRGMTENGLVDILKKLDLYKDSDITHITADMFNKKNVVRSPAVMEVLKLYPDKSVDDKNSE